METNAEYLRRWLRTCPACSGIFHTGLNYMSDQPDEYGVYTVPSPIEYQENILGEMIPKVVQVENYIFASNADYSSDVESTSRQLSFYQQVADWIIEQNNLGNLPEWNGRLMSIVPVLTATPSLVSASVVQYEIQLKATYRRR